MTGNLKGLGSHQQSRWIRELEKREQAEVHLNHVIVSIWTAIRVEKIALGQSGQRAITVFTVCEN